MINIYKFKRNFFTALVLFFFIFLCGFLINPIQSQGNDLNIAYKGKNLNTLDFSLKAIHPNSTLNNGSIEIIISDGNAPFKIIVYSTSIPVKEYQVKKELVITNLAEGEYMIVVSTANNEYKSKTITLRQI